MAESTTLVTLKSKQMELESRISAYEREIDIARKNLVAVGMTIALFQCDNNAPYHTQPGIGLGKIFRRGELPELIFDALKAHPEGLDTRELAAVCLLAKGMDVENLVLRRSMCMRIINTLDKLRIKGRIDKVGMRSGVIVWRAPEG